MGIENAGGGDWQGTMAKSDVCGRGPLAIGGRRQRQRPRYCQRHRRRQWPWRWQWWHHWQRRWLWQCLVHQQQPAGGSRPPHMPPPGRTRPSHKPPVWCSQLPYPSSTHLLLAAPGLSPHHVASAPMQLDLPPCCGEARAGSTGRRRELRLVLPPCRQSRCKNPSAYIPFHVSTAGVLYSHPRARNHALLLTLPRLPRHAPSESPSTSRPPVTWTRPSPSPPLRHFSTARPPAPPLQPAPQYPHPCCP